MSDKRVLEQTEKIRLNLYVPVFLADALDRYANRMGLNRSAAFTVILNQLYEREQAEEYVNVLKEMKNINQIMNQSMGENMTAEDMIKEMKEFVEVIKGMDKEDKING